MEYNEEKKLVSEEANEFNNLKKLKKK